MDVGDDRNSPLDLQWSEISEQAYENLSEINFLLAKRKFCRIRAGVMIVVQLLTADITPRNNIATGIWQVIVSITKKVADAVDYISGLEWYPHHMYETHITKPVNMRNKKHIDKQKDENSEVGVLSITSILKPIVRCAFSILLQYSWLLHGSLIQKQTALKHSVNP